MMKNFSNEIVYKTSRSSGPGGQNVNKVETAVTAMWKIHESPLFSDNEKERIALKLKNKINSEGVLQVTASEARTQLQNKKIATDKMIELVEKALILPKRRKKSSPSKSQIEKRLKTKKQQSEKKENRKFKF